MPSNDVIAKPHISISQVNQHLRCPEQWRCRKELGPRPPGFALLKGGAIHKGAAVNYSQKIDTHEDLPSADVVDASVEALKYRIDTDGYSLTPDEQTIGAKKVIGEVTDRTAILAKLFSDDIAPRRQPIEVEQRQRIVLPDCTHDLVGVVDLITDDGEIPDLKTTGKKKSQKDCDDSLQLTWYALAYQLKYGKPPTKVGFDILVDKAKPEAQFLSTAAPTKGDYEQLIRIVDSVLQSIKAGVFLPAQQEPRSWLCSERSCGYFGDGCRYHTNRRA